MNDTPPQDNAAEMCVLGALMLDHQRIDEVSEILTPRDFYRPIHEQIYAAILAAHAAGERPDAVVTGTRLGAELARVGGAPYLHTLTANVPVTANADWYAAKVAETAVLRRLQDAGRSIIQHAGASGASAAAALEDARRIVDEAASAEASGIGTGIGPLLNSTLDSLDGGVDPGIATGWPDLDDKVNGLRAGQLAIIGARPSVGKSVIAANLTATACKAGVGVHFASLEMTKGEVMKRFLSAHATVDLGRLMAQRLDEADWDRIAKKSGDLNDWPLWVDDTESQTLMQLRARARTTARRLPLGMVVVDYLQLMAPRDRRAPREQQVGELSEGLKALAKELKVPVVALAQVNRGPADRHDKRPMMSDLRESGRIEADADHVWLLHRPDLVERDSATGELEVQVAKNRNGAAGATIKLAFQGHYSRAVSSAWSPSAGATA